MHVGHLRTTVVGDALARMLEHLGHHVIRQNHIGDWGTPFGMLIEHLLDVGEDSAEARLLASDPNAFYQAARAEFDADDGVRRPGAAPGGAAAGRRPRDAAALAASWSSCPSRYFNRVYAMLDVTLTDDDLAGESSYNDLLAGDLRRAGAGRASPTVSDGALCVFLDGFTGREGKPVPLIIRKSDGGYGYATTDLATIRHRVRDLHADRVLYVIGAPQAPAPADGLRRPRARPAGCPTTSRPCTSQIGNVLGADGKILRTRSGAPIRLMALLDEAVERAAARSPTPGPSSTEAGARSSPGGRHRRGQVRRPVGRARPRVRLRLGPDAGADRQHRPLPAVRGRPDPVDPPQAGATPETRPAPIVADRAGRAGAGPGAAGLRRRRGQVGDSLEPHRLCGYLFDLAQAFTTFYEQLPGAQGRGPGRARSRLALSATTLAVLVRGLDLLGIPAPEEM